MSSDPAMDGTSAETSGDGSATGQRCGVAALIGAPNAGKSTLTNALVGQKVAITSAKPQTSRTRLIGVALEGDAQMLLVDTPGIFTPHRRLDRAMVSAAWEGASDADILLFVVDSKAGAGPKLDPLIESINQRPGRKWLVMNKVDIATKDKLLVLAEKLNGAVTFEHTWFVSAETADGLPELKTALADAMPESPWHFPEDQVSDVSQRLLATEITREQIYRQLHAELPYASAVDSEQYLERPDGSLEIHQQILVARDSQKAIMLGKKGARIKAIGEASRAELSKLLGVPVHLYLHVKVKANWDDSREQFENIGLDWVD